MIMGLSYKPLAECTRYGPIKSQPVYSDFQLLRENKPKTQQTNKQTNKNNKTKHNDQLPRSISRQDTNSHKS